jgi:hypothetical protein
MADADLIDMLRRELAHPDPWSSVICHRTDYADMAGLSVWDRCPDRPPTERLLLALDAALAALADVWQALAEGTGQAAGNFW